MQDSHTILSTSHKRDALFAHINTLREQLPALRMRVQHVAECVILFGATAHHSALCCVVAHDAGGAEPHCRDGCTGNHGSRAQYAGASNGCHVCWRSSDGRWRCDHVCWQFALAALQICVFVPSLIAGARLALLFRELYQQFFSALHKDDCNLFEHVDDDDIQQPLFLPSASTAADGAISDDLAQMYEGIGRLLVKR